jgi:signal transduction histidine kinase
MMAASSEPPEESLAQFTRKMTQIGGVDSCALWQWQAQDNTLTAIAGHLALPQQLTILPLADYPARGQVLSQQMPLLLSLTDPQTDRAEKARLEALQRTQGLILPLLYRQQSLGIMELYTRREQPSFDEADTLFFYQTLANQAALMLQNNRLITELAAGRAALHQLSLQVIKAQEDERRRISRELHDELGQTLTALKINLEVAMQLLPPRMVAQLQESLAESKSLAGQALEMARGLSLRLRPTILDDLGLAAALRWEIDRYERRTGQAVYFEFGLNGLELPPELAITVYRIIAEALTNISRHAQAEHVEAKVWLEQHLLRLEVEDDGVGFNVEAWFANPTQRKSLGIVSMQERAKLLNGDLQITSQPGRGTKISAYLPLELT